MSTNQQICAGHFCGQLKSNQNRQIWYRLAINKVCYSYFVSSYQDKNNEMIAFTEKYCLYPPTGKIVPDSTMECLSLMSTNRAKYAKQLCGQFKFNQNKQI